MKDLLQQFENKAPEIVFNWKDSETEAEGWTVINSLRGGAAGGGTRMRKGLDMNEVLSLAKTMEVKFSVSGPAIGGAKSGINFDPNDPRKKGVLQRWYKAVSPLLKSYYGTGGDLNVDEIHEVIPMTEECGVWHPQEGVFNGHFKPTEADKINRIGQLRQGVVKVIENTTFSPDINRKYTVADMITGFGVAEAVRHYYDIYGGTIVGKKAIVQGFGNVGSISAKLIAQLGVKIVAISDVTGGYYNPEGIDVNAAIAYVANSESRSLDGYTGGSKVTNAELLELPCDILVPAAMEDQITPENASRIKAKMIVEGANGPTTAEADSILNEKGILVVPDILANAGGVTVSYFEWVQNRLGYYWTEERVNRRADRAMKQAFDNVYATAEKYGVNMRIAAYIVALDKVASTLKLRGSF